MTDVNVSINVVLLLWRTRLRCCWQCDQMLRLKVAQFIEHTPTADLLFDWFGFSCFAVLNYQQSYWFGQTQTSQTGGQLYSDTSPYKAIKFSLLNYSQNCPQKAIAIST